MTDLITAPETSLAPEPDTNINIKLRPPTTSNSAITPDNSFVPPAPAWLEGTWHVTHSSLPMWKKARNVAITYKPLASDGTKIDDLVTYNDLSGDKVKKVAGVDTAAGTGAYNWRGKGWLKIASSHWQVLGFGELQDGHQWVVTYFAKTLFTPAGIDVYSRKKEGLPEATVTEIKEALAKVDAPDVKALVGSIFSITHN